jgi:hypothetical protein
MAELKEVYTVVEDYNALEKIKVEDIKIEQTLKLNANDIHNIMVNALEGGSNYWIGLDSVNHPFLSSKPKGLPTSVYVADCLLVGGSVEFYDIEEPDDEHFTLTLQKLRDGIKIYMDKGHTIEYFKDQKDAGDDDCILQYSLFGKLVYG